MRNKKEIKPKILWRLMLNNKKTNASVTRLLDTKEHFEYLVKNVELSQNTGFFKVRTNIFSSHMMDMIVDVIFVDNDEKVVKLYELFKPMRLTENFPETKYIYIMGSGTIKYNKIEVNDILTHQKFKRK